MRNAADAANPFAAPGSATYQRPNSVLPSSASSLGTASVIEPYPDPAPVPPSVIVARAKLAVGGIASTGGSASSRISTASAAPSPLNTPIVNAGLPASGGSSA